MGLISRYEIKTTSHTYARCSKKNAPRDKKDKARTPAQWFQRLVDTGLICGMRRNDKLRVFIQLCRLATMAAGHGTSDLAGAIKTRAEVPAIERAARWQLERQQILGDVRERYERLFLEFYTREENDILRDVEHGFIDFGETKTVLNSALMDIVRAGDRRRPIITVITSVCGIKAKGKK